MTDSAEERLARIRGERGPEPPPDAALAPAAGADGADENVPPSSATPRPVPLDARAGVQGQEAGFGCLLALGFIVAAFLTVFGMACLAFALADRAVVGVVVAVLILGAAAGVIGGMVAWVRRCRTWLSGTTLVVRGPFRTCTCDLATCSVSVDWVVRRAAAGTASNGARRSIPFLVLDAAGTGRAVRLDLRKGRRRLLPPDQLHLLATAISTGPRPKPADQQAQEIAATLRQLADDSFGDHR